MNELKFKFLRNMKLYRTIIENGLFVKGAALSQKELKNLSLGEVCLIEKNELITVVAFDKAGNPQFADKETTFEFTKDETNL